MIPSGIRVGLRAVGRAARWNAPEALPGRLAHFYARCRLHSRIRDDVGPYGFHPGPAQKREAYESFRGVTGTTQLPGG